MVRIAPLAPGQPGLTGLGGPVAAAPPRAADAVSVPPPLPDPTPKPAPRKPAPAPPTQPTPSSLRPSVRRELLLVVVFYAAYSLVRILLNDPGGPARAFANAAAVLDVERAMFLDVELALNRALVASEALSLAANLFYLGAHFAVTLAVLVWLYLARARHYAPLRTALVAATGLALVGFWLYPLAPPRFLPSEGFLDPVTVFGTPGLYASDVSAAMTNQYAAMPSMHAGWALWCGIALAVHGRRWWTRLLGVIYPVCTFAVVLATANHYVLDVVAGVALVLGALGAALGAARFKTAPRLKAVPWVSARFRRRPAR